MTLRDLVLCTAVNACEHNTAPETLNVLDELISFSCIWADVLDLNLEDIDIKAAPHL